MADPASIYDPDKKEPVTRPDLKVIEGGSETSSPPTSDSSATPEPADLAKKEKVPTDPYQVGRGYTGTSKQNKQKGRKWLFNKRRTALGGGLLGTIVAILLFFTFASGPLQLIHLSQILQKPMAGLSKDNDIRGSSLFRYWKSGDIGKTRVTFLGSYIFDKKILPGLNANGIDFMDRNPTTGRPGAVELDSSKHPATKGQKLNILGQRQALARFYDVPESVIELYRSPASGERIFRVATPPGRQGLNLLAKLERISLTATGQGNSLKGRIHAANESRIMKRHYGQPRLFSGLTKGIDFEERSSRWWNNKLKAKEERAKEREDRRAQQRAQYSAAAAEKIRNARNSLSPSTLRVVKYSTIGTAATCIARDIAGGVAIANRAAVVAPSVIETADKMAIGSQAQAGVYDDGSPLDMSQLGVVVDGFKNEKDGSTIWDAKALQALANNGEVRGGTDLDLELKQAFGNEDVEQKLKDEYDIAILGIPIGGILCSTPVVIGQVVAFGLLTAASCVGSAPTLGAALPACVGSIGRYAAAGAATYAVLAVTSPKFVDALSDEAITDFAGAQGGNLMAHSAIEVANITARASGGVKLSAQETTSLKNEQRLEDQKEFQSKSLASRLFDIYDHRSLAAKIIDKSSTKPLENVASLANSFLNVGSWIKSFSSFTNVGSWIKSFSSFTPFPKAQAAEETYDFGFPAYGMSREILENPDFENPYDNADKAADLFEQGRFVDKAKKCFGVDIKKDSDDKWTAVAVDDVNPASHEYHKEKCDDTDPDWLRVRLFIFDSRLMDSIACYEGDEASCSQLGFDNSATAPGTTAGTQIVGNIGNNSDSIACATGTNNLGVVTTKYTGTYKLESGPLIIRLCQVPDIPGQGNNAQGIEISGGAIVNSRVSGAWSALGKAAIAAGVSLSSNSSFRLSDSCEGTGTGGSCATPGGSPHQMGVAIDFGNMSGIDETVQICSIRLRDLSSSSWRWMYKYAAMFGFEQYSAEAWHWDPLPASNRCNSSEPAGLVP